MIRNEKGVTLIEVLIVSGAMVIVLAGIYSFYLSGQKIFHSGAEQVELHDSLRLTAEKISRELRFAESVTLLPEDWDLKAPQQTATAISTMTAPVAR